MRIYLISLFILFNIIRLDAQHFELGAALGGSNYLGDLTPSSLLISLGETNISVGAFARYNMWGWVSIRGGINYGKIGASDADVIDDNDRALRNLSFQSNIFEVALTAEINLLRYLPEDLDRPFSPYVFGGIAIFHFNPQAEFEGKWYDLQPLGTEGQGLEGFPEKYNLTQISIPAGFGIKFTTSEQWNIGLEFGMRKTFTDYLDDVSESYPNLDELAHVNGALAAELSWRSDEVNPSANPPRAGSGRGDPIDLDWYVFTGVTLSYNFFNNGSSGRRGTRGGTGCYDKW